MSPSPRPGTLEWLADQRPDEAVLLTPDAAVTRVVWEARAAALADRLARDHGVGAGGLLTVSGRLGPVWATAGWAAAKLGAGVTGLPPGPVTAPAGAIDVDASAEQPGADAAVARRLSATGALPDSVTFSAAGRPVRRSFTPEAVAALAPTLADLVARVRAAPGTTLVVCGPVSDAVSAFVANVVLVGGGRVVSAPTPLAALALAGGHGAALAALPPAELGSLARADRGALEALDLTLVEAIVTGGAPVTATAASALDDLFGADAAIDVYATADTGVIAVRGRGDEHHVVLEGVELRLTAGERLEVRSPLSAAPGWTATGDPARLHPGGRLQLL